MVRSIVAYRVPFEDACAILGGEKIYTSSCARYFYVYVGRYHRKTETFDIDWKRLKVAKERYRNKFPFGIYEVSRVSRTSDTTKGCHCFTPTGENVVLVESDTESDFDVDEQLEKIFQKLDEISNVLEFKPGCEDPSDYSDCSIPELISIESEETIEAIQAVTQCPFSSSCVDYIPLENTECDRNSSQRLLDSDDVEIYDISVEMTSTDLEEESTESESYTRLPEGETGGCDRQIIVNEESTESVNTEYYDVETRLIEPLLNHKEDSDWYYEGDSLPWPRVTEEQLNQELEEMRLQRLEHFRERKEREERRDREARERYNREQWFREEEKRMNNLDVLSELCTRDSLDIELERLLMEIEQNEKYEKYEK